MAGEATASGDDLPFHQLSASSVGALARGLGGGSTVEELLSAERSRRLLLLRALDNELSRDDDPASQATDTVSHRAAWSLLERAQRHAPHVVEDVLMAPPTGMWLSLALRQLRGRAYEDAPLWVVRGHLSALAAAAGARAGLDFSITVPVRRGLVPLPTLGSAVLPVTEPWSTARIVVRAGQLRITGAQGEVVIERGGEKGGPGWHAVRRLTLGSGDGQKPLVLEELDPYRTFPRPSEPRLLSGDEAEDWERMLTGAWEVLLRDEPESAEAMRHGLMSVAPTPTKERFRPYSGTAGDAFGGVTASRPDDVAQLAATLVHEFQHTKLGGLMHLEPLSTSARDAETPEELFYAPWRDDPRPLGGLLQGIYAFAGVARFWGAHRHSADAAYAPLAHFEFALWRTQVWSTLNQVRRHDRLTPLGQRVLESLGECCARWMADPVPPAELALAREAAADHRARWRAHHLRPPAAAVDDAVRAWQRGDARPPAGLAAEPALVPDTEVRFLDTAAVLTRHHLSEPEGDWRFTAAQGAGADGGVEGATEADVLLACGDHTAAREALTAQLSVKGAPVAAWVGLGRALTDKETHRAASQVLIRHPERARAVQDALEAATGRGADPVRLAAWLGRGEETRGRR